MFPPCRDEGRCCQQQHGSGTHSLVAGGEDGPCGVLPGTGGVGVGIRPSHTVWWQVGKTVPAVSYWAGEGSGWASILRGRKR